MKKSYRIRKNEEFTRIIGEKHSNASANFVLYYSDRKFEENARAGISVSKKLGDAVDRNRIKRQVREMIRAVFNFDISSKDIIVIVRPPYLKNDYQTNLLDLEKLIKKAII